MPVPSASWADDTAAEEWYGQDDREQEADRTAHGFLRVDLSPSCKRCAGTSASRLLSVHAYCREQSPVAESSHPELCRSFLLLKRFELGHRPPVRTRAWQRISFAILLPAGVYLLASVAVHILSGDSETLRWYWGLPLVMLLPTGAGLLWFRPMWAYWRDLKGFLRNVGYRPSPRSKALVLELLRGSPLDDDRSLHAGEIWMRVQERQRIFWGTYFTSGEHLRYRVFVAAVPRLSPRPSASRAAASPADHDLLLDAYRAVDGFSFFLWKGALIGRLGGPPIEGRVSDAPEPSMAIDLVEQLAVHLPDPPCNGQAG